MYYSLTQIGKGEQLQFLLTEIQDCETQDITEVAPVPESSENETYSRSPGHQGNED